MIGMCSKFSTSFTKKGTNGIMENILQIALRIITKLVRIFCCSIDLLTDYPDWSDKRSTTITSTIEYRTNTEVEIVGIPNLNKSIGIVITHNHPTCTVLLYDDFEPRNFHIENLRNVTPLRGNHVLIIEGPHCGKKGIVSNVIDNRISIELDKSNNNDNNNNNNNNVVEHMKIKEVVKYVTPLDFAILFASKRCADSLLCYSFQESSTSTKLLSLPLPTITTFDPANSYKNEDPLEGLLRLWCQRPKQAIQTFSAFQNLITNCNQVYDENCCFCLCKSCCQQLLENNNNPCGKSRIYKCINEENYSHFTDFYMYYDPTITKLLCPPSFTCIVSGSNYFTEHNYLLDSIKQNKEFEKIKIKIIIFYLNFPIPIVYIESKIYYPNEFPYQLITTPMSHKFTGSLKGLMLIYEARFPEDIILNKLKTQESIKYSCNDIDKEVTTMCPITKSIWTIPVKSFSCEHDTYFDLKPYLLHKRINCKINNCLLCSWLCPICKQLSTLDKLSIEVNLLNEVITFVQNKTETINLKNYIKTENTQVIEKPYNSEDYSIYKSEIMVKNEEEIITDTITTEDKKSKRKISKETYECHYCLKKYTNYNKLLDHIELVHPEPIEKRKLDEQISIYKEHSYLSKLVTIPVTNKSVTTKLVTCKPGTGNINESMNTSSNTIKDKKDKKPKFEINTEKENDNNNNNKNNKPETKNSSEVPKIPRKERIECDIESIEIISLGSIMTEFSENFHCINYIWPIGYQIKRTWYNYENPLEMITYICEISKSGNGSNTMPLFNVTCQTLPPKKVTASSPTACWKYFVEKVNLALDTYNISHIHSFNGNDLFGLSNSLIKTKILELPNVNNCTKYKRNNKRS